MKKQMVSKFLAAYIFLGLMQIFTFPGFASESKAGINKPTYMVPKAEIKEKINGNNERFILAASLNKDRTIETKEQKEVLMSKAVYREESEFLKSKINTKVSLDNYKLEPEDINNKSAFLDAILVGKTDIEGALTSREISEALISAKEAIDKVESDVDKEADINVLVRELIFPDMDQRAVKNEEYIIKILNERLESAVKDDDVQISINKTSYNRARSGSIGHFKGIDGNYSFTVTTSKNGNFDRSVVKSVVIKATPYSVLPILIIILSLLTFYLLAYLIWVYKNECKEEYVYEYEEIIRE